MSLPPLPDQYRPIINLHLDYHQTPEEQRRWVRWCKKQGYGGFALIFGDTLKTDRIDEQWYQNLFAATRNVAQEAKEQGLAVWIFDEWGYPSCVAGGLVGEQEELRSKKLHVALDLWLEPGQTVQFPLPQRLVSLKAVPVNRFGFYAPGGPCRPVLLEETQPGALVTYTAGDTKERLVAVTWETISFITHVAVQDNPNDYALGTTDLLGKAAAQRFLEVVHQRFYEALPEYFGTVIKGFFYDEPEICFDFPWTVGLEEEFLRRKGYDLRDELPLMVCYSGVFYHPGWEEADAQITRLTRDYFDVWTDLAAENFYGALQTWCHDHGLTSVGHQDMDNWTKTLPSVSGHFYKNNRYNDHPGIDVINDNIEIGRFNDFPRFAGSAKRLYGKERAMSETFALMGIGQSPDRQRFLMEHQVIRGVDEFFNMISPVAEEPDALAPFTRGNQVGDRHGYHINTHVGRCAQLCNLGVSRAETALYLPMEEIYLAQLKDRDPHNLNGALPWISVDRIAKLLAYAPCDFDYIWDQAILELPLQDGAFAAPKGQRIRTVILPQGAELSPMVKEKLIAFCQSGGRVISMLRRWGEGCEKEFTLCPDYPDLKDFLSLPVQVKGPARLSLCHRQEEDKEYFLLLNESAQDYAGQICFSGPEGYWLYEVDLLTGGMTLANRGLSLEAGFPSGQLRCLVSAAPGAFEAPAIPGFTSAPCPVTISLATPDGKERLLNPDAMPDWEQLGYGDYYGYMRYAVSFDWAGGPLFVSLGQVCHSAVVSLDQKINPEEEGRLLSFAPFGGLFGQPEPGRHTLYVYVQNTPANRCLGALEAEKSAGDQGQNDADRKMLRSGLFGPVLIG